MAQRAVTENRSAWRVRRLLLEVVMYEAKLSDENEKLKAEIVQEALTKKW
jgi:hypothetical protein